MGQFARQFKDYEQYDDQVCYRRSVPANLSNALADVLASSCGPDGEPATAAVMRSVTDDLLAMAGKKPTGNWDAGALKTEIRAAFHILEESTFDKFIG
jgi:hypothetical protein